MTLIYIYTNYCKESTTIYSPRALPWPDNIPKHQGKNQKNSKRIESEKTYDRIEKKE